MNSRVLQGITLAARIALGAVFLFAGLGKIQATESFAQSILNYRVVSDPLLVHAAAIVIPWLELVSGFSLLVGYCRRGSAVIILVLLGVFVAAITQGMVRHLDIACGCFTQDPSAGRIGFQKLLEDMVLGILAVISFKSSYPPSLSA